MADAAESTRVHDDARLLRFRHDARTPLHTIQGFTQLLRECALDDPCDRYVAMIEDAVQQLDRLINELG